MRTGAQPWYPRSNSFKKTKIYCDKLMVIQESISAENTKEKKKVTQKNKKIERLDVHWGHTRRRDEKNRQTDR